MMHHLDDFACSQQKDFACVQMKYKVRGTSMLIVLPNKGVKFQEFVKKFGAKEFQTILNSLKWKNVELGLPRFKVEADYKLIPVLQRNGIEANASDVNERAQCFFLSSLPICGIY
jgi:serine protease inhibitor